MKLIKTIGAALIGAGISTNVAAQGYPNKPVRIIVAYPAGPGNRCRDALLRRPTDARASVKTFSSITDRARGPTSARWRPRARPADGYTLTMGTNATHGVNQFLYANVGFDPEKDFEPIILTGTFPMVIAASPTAPINSIADLLATVKAKPKSADIAMPSTTARSGVRVSQGAQQRTAVRRSVQGIRRSDDRSDGRSSSVNDRYRHRVATARSKAAS